MKGVSNTNLTAAIIAGADNRNARYGRKLIHKIPPQKILFMPFTSRKSL